MFIRVKYTPTDSLWINGTIWPLGWKFEAKVYELPSSFGIESGRVSKLQVTTKKRKILFHYDRGWVEIPNTTLQYLALKSILKEMEKIE
jgi:hypothetical protein